MKVKGITLNVDLKKKKPLLKPCSLQKTKPNQTKLKQTPQKQGKNIRGKFLKKWRREGKVLHLWLEDERMNLKSGFKQRLRSQRLRKWKDSHLIHFCIKQYLREIITKHTI